MAEGGVGRPRSRASSLRGKNSAFLLPNQNEASPATLQFIARHRRKILFSLREKEMNSTSSPQIRRAEIKKCEENFLAGWRALARNGGGACPPKRKRRRGFLIGGFAQKMFELQSKTTAEIHRKVGFLVYQCSV